VFDCLAIINLWQSSTLVEAGYSELDGLLTEAITDIDHPIIAHFSKHDVNSLQLCEFLVQTGELHHVKDFCALLREMPLLTYLDRLFDGDYSVNDLQRILNGDAGEPPEQPMGLIDPYSWGTDLALLHRPLLALVESVHEHSTAFIKSLLPGLLAYQKQLHRQLSLFSPLEVSQTELAKRFIRVSDYQKFGFVVSPFAVRAMRFFDDETLLTFTGPNKNNVIRTNEEAVKLLKVLADDTRLAILALLANEKLYGKQIADRLGKTTATISHHLDALHHVGLIRQEKLQQTKYYSFHPKALDQQFESISALLKK
jgi:DNA-binding transcriptional ArsR family regulator